MHAGEGKLSLFNGFNRVSAKSARIMLRRASLAAVGGAVVLPVISFLCPLYAAGNINTLYSLGLTGAGVDVAQVEAEEGESTGTLFYFEDNPAYVNQPANFFEYIDSNGHTSTSPGAVSTIGSTTYTDEISAHAENVGRWYFGEGAANWGSAAYGISHVDNYDAGWFQDDVVFTGSVSGQTFNPTTLAHSDAVVNQSFVNSSATASEIQLIDSGYDYYTNYYTDKFSNTDGGDFGPIFVSAIGNGTQTSTTPASDINPPATMYNGIAVGLYGANVPGPTYDGRSKPDIVTPDNVAESSYAAPQVSAAAAILVQAGGLGPVSSGNYSGPVGFTVSNGGLAKAAYETDAMDERTVKALLLNGADKPLGWSHTHTQPLNQLYGSGIFDVYNS